MVLPAILNPFIEGAPACVMTRIALDWIIEGTPFDQLFEQAAQDQYTREFTLEHLVLVMLDVVCGFNPSTRSAFLGRQLQLIAALSAFYGKLNRLGPAITANPSSNEYPEPRTVRIGSRPRPSALRRRPTWTSTVRSST